MKKIVISVLALLLLTGCSNNSSDQTLFVVNKKDQYGLIDIDGDKKTRFIYDSIPTNGKRWLYSS